MKTQKNTQGMISPVVIVLIVVVLAAAGFAGWKVMSNNKDNKNSSTTGSSAPATTNNAAVASACLKAINDKNICNFASHYNANASYTATDTSSTSSGSGTLTISVDGKGNSSFSGTIGGQQSDFISLNGATYIKDPTSGTWIKYSSSSTQTQTNPADSLKVSSSDITAGGTISYKSLGTAPCGSDTCYKYQIVDTTQPNSTEYVWFDNKNYQLHEFYVKDADGTNDMAFAYKSVNITTPSPVTDYSVPGAPANQ